MNKQNLTCKRSSTGFTMMEVMIVVAILGIMAALIFVNVIPFLRSMYQKEMDGTAKEIYIAAQNHLTIADSMGFLEKAGQTKGEEGSGAERYYVVGEGDGSITPQGLNATDENYTNSYFFQMLPYGAIDETIRSGGSYVISYNPQTAVVLDVFYTNPNGRYGNGHKFSAANYSDLMTNYKGDSKNGARQNYAGDGTIIGWYGGDGAGVAANSLPAPNVTVENGDKLILKAQWPSASNANAKDAEKLPADLIPDDSKGSANKLEVSMIVTGKTSKTQSALKGLGLVHFDGYGYDQNFHTYAFVLDDITTPGKHFVEQFSGFIPGEDIEIQVFAYCTSELYNVAKARKATTNSLFNSVGYSPGEGSIKIPEANISSIRHLENLSRTVSGYDPKMDKVTIGPVQLGTEDESTVGYTTVSSQRSTGGTLEGTSPGPTHAVQLGDISWSTFKANTNGVATQVFSLGGEAAEGTEQGCFMPVNLGWSKDESNNDRVLDYNGGGHRIDDVKVVLSANAAADAGLFGSLTGGSLKNLELVNFNIKAANGNAGALAGSLNGTTVESVLVRNEANAQGIFSDGEATDAGLEITGIANAGGLVGSMTNGSVSKCAASVYVSATTAAGGLVGMSTGATIEKSYAGGHTVDGEYSTTDVTAQTGLFPGRWNVQAGTAGGLVGATNANVANCYATCSVKGTTIGGGLVGSATGGSISGSYAEGLVDATTAGFLVGSMTTGLELGNNYYVATVNRGLNAVGSDGEEAPNNEKATDVYESRSSTTVSELDAYRNITSANTSAPYDPALVAAYTFTANGANDSVCHFPLLTIKDLVGGTLGATDPVWLSIHYGDWQKPETEVVNTPAQSNG